MHGVDAELQKVGIQLFPGRVLFLMTGRLPIPALAGTIENQPFRLWAKDAVRPNGSLVKRVVGEDSAPTVNHL